MSGPFIPLGDIVGDPHSSGALAISEDGNTIAGFGASPDSKGGRGQWEAVAWVNFQLVRLGGYTNGPTFHSSVRALSGDGKFAAGDSLGKSLPGAPHTAGAYPTRWDIASRRMQDLRDPAQPYGSAVALALSHDGSIVAGSAAATTANLAPQEGFLWSVADGFRGIGFLPDAIERRSIVFSLSPDGEVAVGEGTNAAGANEAFVYRKASGLVGLGPLKPSEWCSASAISGDAAIIAGISGTFPVIWSASRRCESLGLLPGTRGGVATAVSYDGSVVVGRCDNQAFVWTRAKGIRDLRATIMDKGPHPSPVRNWQLVTAAGISADGSMIVGEALNPDGKSEAYLVQL